MPRHLGRYELLHPIGRGGMAEVWLARHRGAGGVEKRVVIKRILRERASDPRFLDLFVSEAQISMALTHKNIVPTFDFGRVGDELFLVMEYVEGTNLAVAMQQATREDTLPSAPLICHIAFEACQALDYAHRYKDPDGTAVHIAHRDVTPANLLLSTAGEVKLGDFGLARATAGKTEAEGNTRGTPRYMAPEQALGGVVGPPADIFALGLLLRDCLSGVVLRQGTQQEQLASARLPVPETPKTIPQDLRTICERSTQFRPEDRYANARAMGKELDRALLHARMAEVDDGRPMPERLADWLTSLQTSVEQPVGKKKPNIAGDTVTYLDHGTAEVLAGGGDATMRSMAATGIESANTSEIDVQEQTTKAPRRSWPVLATLVGIPLSVASYLLIGANADTAVGTIAPDATIGEPVPVDAAMVAVLQVAVPIDASVEQHTDAQMVKIRIPPKQRSTTPTKPPVNTQTGELRISTTPWAAVTIVGRSETCSETPCRLTLPAGSYELLLRNPVAGLKKKLRVQVRASASTKIHEVLEAPQQ